MENNLNSIVDSKYCKYKKLDKFICSSAYIYLAFPIVLLIMFWFKIYIAIPAILAIIIALVLSLKNFKYKTVEEYQKIFNKKYIAIIFLIILFLNILSGAGGIFYQNWDYKGRNAIFHDLIDRDWPVKYDYSKLEYEKGRIESETGVLSYYFAYWLPGALVGKVLGFKIASIFMLMWQIIGTTLFFYLVFRKLNNIKIKYLLVFVAFGGLDIITQLIVCLINGQPVDLIGVIHIDTANGNYCMSTFITQLFWVFNQSIPAWIATMLMVNEEKFENLGVILALLVPYSPFPVLGLAIWMAITVLFGYNLEKIINVDRIKKVLSIQNIITILAIIPIGLLFLQNSSEKGLVLIRALKNGNLGRSILMYVLYLILEFGIYAVIINKENRRRVLAYFGIFAILPLFYLGTGLDLGNRATIPILVLLYVEILKFMDSNDNKKRIYCLYFILLVAFGTNFNEFYRSFKYTFKNLISHTTNFNDSYFTFSEFEGKECDNFIKNFVAPYDEDNIFFTRILK